MTLFVILFVCKLSFSSCVVLPDYEYGYTDAKVCQTELEKRVGLLRVNFPVSEGWRVIGYCGLPLSGARPKA